jgi:hypothetical protein
LGLRVAGLGLRVGGEFWLEEQKEKKELGIVLVVRDLNR